MIPYEQRYRIAEGSYTDFATRVMFALRREAAYKLPSATGQDLAACRAVWANATNFRLAITLAVLADQFFTAPDVQTLLDTPDDGMDSIQSAVAAQWASFVSVFFPAGV
ncbi:MAG: hypothetical protein WBA46_00990 [Thermomicrobiales bacterium]